jgi:hypothetical protein
MAYVSLHDCYDSEIAAVAMYTAALATAAPDEAKVLRHILEEEKEHAAMLEDLIHGDDRSLRQRMRAAAGITA